MIAAEVISGWLSAENCYGLTGACYTIGELLLIHMAVVAVAAPFIYWLDRRRKWPK